MFLTHLMTLPSIDVFNHCMHRWPDLKIITHHAGGTIPMMEGRLNAGLESLGNRYAPEDAHAAKTDLKEKPLDAFRGLYTDTATFGSRIAMDAGIAFFGAPKTFFATDFPFAKIGETLAAAEGLDASVFFLNAARIFSLASA